MHLLAAVVVLLQDKTAEETFQKIEVTIEKAKTVTVKFKVDGSTKQGERETKVQMSGTFYLGEGNKAHIAYKRRIGEHENELELVSDGKKFKANAGDPGDVPGNMNTNFKVALSRISIFVSSRAASTKEHNGVREEISWKDAFLVSEIKSGPDDHDAKTLTYKLKVGDRETLDVQVWYDPKTLKILKRTLSGKSGENQATLTETYESLVLNAEIPDEKFKLPEK